jgi:3-oxoacyl-[acyl-carrier protein] reductase
MSAPGHRAPATDQAGTEPATGQSAVPPHAAPEAVMPAERSTTPLRLDLSGRVAVVTGAGRRQGIGAAVCRLLAAHGAAVLFSYWQPYDAGPGVGLDADGPAALAAELHRLGRPASGLALDLTQPGAPERLLATARQRLGPPSILINNAAYSTTDGFEQLTAEQLDAHYAVNLRALALLSVAFARDYDGRPGGRIINLTSGQSLTPMPNELAYAATKGAVEAFTRSLAVGVAARRITVNAVDPGATDTGWMSEALKDSIRASLAAGRLGQPADAAHLILFLVSDAGEWITGQILHSRGA